ncbi:substrate-binding domain-containing protein [Cellulomonas rhizosphaerae]|uniref:Sugar ABC transporter substrate-binding protein n=1 Tax=Cellulomonas rhizosphaerae TaxID=2293719 RepID=A0A413RRV6_9CELL|nr:sugar-binding protein [Cellulomonas rhizosphaerae]RHA44617.1 sugar ABC transporter substrate-binding protein [Cellulomonas rhizosphaerae]
MKMRVGAAALLFLVGVNGCSAQVAADSSGAPLVGIAMPTTEQTRWVADGDNLSAQFHSLGYRVDKRYAENDVAAQVAHVQDMVDEGADALVIGAVDGTALTAVLAKAHAAGIAVISYDRLIRESKDVDYYASFDNARVGVMQGTALLQGLGVIDATGKRTAQRGPFHVEVFAGSPDDNNATVFYDGAMSVLKPYLTDGTLVVASGEVAREDVAIEKWDPPTAGKRMDSLLGRYGKGPRLDGVLAPNDGIAQAVIGSAKTLGYVPVVTGQDAEIPAVRSVAAGEQYSTVYKDTRQLAEVTVAMVNALLEGDEPEVNDTTTYDNGVKVVPSYLLPPRAVTKDNYRRLLVDGGYYTAEEVG